MTNLSIIQLKQKTLELNIYAFDNHQVYVLHFIANSSYHIIIDQVIEPRMLHLPLIAVIKKLQHLEEWECFQKSNHFAKQKQSSRGVLRKRCSENMHCNFIEVALRNGCSLVNLLHIFGTAFPKNISGGLLLEKYWG